MRLYELLQLALFPFLRMCAALFGGTKFKSFVAQRIPSAFDAALNRACANLPKPDTQCPRVWVHVASAGELEQAIPVARDLAKRHGAVFFLTYFSPSAEPFVKNFPNLLGAHALPLDLRSNHRQILTRLNICHVLLVRYDFWPAMLSCCKHLGVPVSLLAATLAPTRPSFVLAGLAARFRARSYARFHAIFAVTPAEAKAFSNLLASDISNSRRDMSQPARLPLVAFAGDPKWSRAKERAAVSKSKGFEGPLGNFATFARLQRLSLGRCVLVFGSPHAEEHALAMRALGLMPRPFVIYVPHDVTELGVTDLVAQVNALGAKAMLLSKLEHVLQTQALQSGALTPPAGVESLAPGWDTPAYILQQKVATKLPVDSLQICDAVIVDRVGVLAEIYALADVAIVGGGFDGQIHNTLEPAAHPVATVFGNQLYRSREAQTLVEEKAALSFVSPEEMFHFLRQCVRVNQLPLEGTSTLAQPLVELRYRALQLFEQIPNTSEVVSRALFPTQGPETT